MNEYQRFYLHIGQISRSTESQSMNTLTRVGSLGTFPTRPLSIQTSDNTFHEVPLQTHCVGEETVLQKAFSSN